MELDVLPLIKSQLDLRRCLTYRRPSTMVRFMSASNAGPKRKRAVRAGVHTGAARGDNTDRAEIRTGGYRAYREAVALVAT